MKHPSARHTFFKYCPQFNKYFLLSLGIYFIFISATLARLAADDTVQAAQAESIQQLATKLQNYKTIRKASEQLMEMSASDQAALQPLIKLYTHKRSDKGTTNEILRFAFSHMKKYFRTHKASQDTINNLLHSISHCIENKNGWRRSLPTLIVAISQKTLLNAEQIDSLVQVAKRDQQIVNYRLHSADAAIPILKAISYQGKYHVFNDEVRELARKFIQSQHKLTQATGMSIFSSQRHFNDKKSKEVIKSILEKPANRYISNRTLMDSVKYLMHRKNSDDEILQLIKLYQSNKINLSNSPLLFKPLLSNPDIKETTRAKIFAITTQRPEAYDDYLELISIKEQSGSKAPDDGQLAFLLRIYSHYPGHDLNQQAMQLLTDIEDKYGLSTGTHHALIKHYINSTRLQRANEFYQFVVNSIPFSYYHGDSKNSYNEALIKNVIDKIQPETSIENARILKILTKISQHQALSRQHIDSLYPFLSAFKQDATYTKFIADILTEHYNKTGYADIKSIQEAVNGSPHANRKLFKILLSEIKNNENTNRKQALLDYFTDINLSNDARIFSLSELIKLDFNFAQENTLPPFASDSRRMKHSVWSVFSEHARQNKLKIDKQKLLAATNDPDHYTQRLAWQRLEDHGISIPVTAQLKHPYYRKVLIFNTLLIASLLSIILAYFLYTGGIKKHNSKAWGITQVSLWILASLGFVAFSIGGILLGGMSHSGYPYESISYFLLISNTIYIAAGLLLRFITHWYIKTGDKQIKEPATSVN